jgi:hypothetical protein
MQTQTNEKRGQLSRETFIKDESLSPRNEIEAVKSCCA